MALQGVGQLVEQGRREPWRGFAGSLRAQLRMPLQLQPCHRARQPRGLKRLDQVVERAFFKRLYGVLLEGGDEDDEGASVDGACSVHTVHAGHVHVQEHDVGCVLVKELHRLAAVARLGHDLELGPGNSQLRGQALAQQRFVVGDEGADHAVTTFCMLAIKLQPAIESRRARRADGLR